MSNQPIADDLGEGPWLVFVYGTLKQGYGNNHYLQDGSAHLIGRYRTVEDFDLADGGFPRMVEAGHSSYSGSVVGEVWSVTDRETMQNMDRLEGHPRWYVRQPREVVSIKNGTKKTAFMYVMPRERFTDTHARWCKPSVLNHRLEWKRGQS